MFTRGTEGSEPGNRGSFFLKGLMKGGAEGRGKKLKRRMCAKVQEQMDSEVSTSSEGLLGLAGG